MSEIVEDRIGPPAGPTPVTLLSLVGCSGHPMMKRTLKRIVPDQWITSVKEDGERVKLAGHRRYSPENVARFERHDVRAVLIVRDPRDILVNLVNRSLRDWCSEKFERPRTHPSAVEFHRLLKGSEEERGDQPYVEFYVDTIGARDVLHDIFQVAAWTHHPRVHTVRFEDFIDLHGDDQGEQQDAIKGVADFVGVPISESDIEAVSARCDVWIRKKVGPQPEFEIGWQEVFSEEDKIAFKNHFGQVLIDLGYEQDDGW